MEVKATFKLGENGTNQLFRQYGDQLVCVRYRLELRSLIKNAGGYWNPEKKA